MNTLYYGDNLEVLRQHVKDESVDLIYLDPPFNSNASYNVLFAERDGSQAASQIKAFEDTWQWDAGAARACQDVIEAGGKVSEAMQAFRTFLGDSNMMAYLAMMAPRLVELRRVLKATGSIYLHCDPTASHYLKMLMDAIFGPVNFGSEIVWKRYGAHNDAKRYGAVHDVILFYTRSSKDAVFNKQHQTYDPAYVEERFRFSDPDGRRWAEQNLASPNPRPNLTYPFTTRNGITYEPPPNGWKYTQERMRELEEAGRLHFPARTGGRLRLKNYLEDMPGVPVQDVWTDISMIGGTSPERLGYPTQKPEALLDRIIASSSNEGDTILDPFCGCGTAIASAQKLNRRWIGIDITSLAINLIRVRLADTFGAAAKFEVIGEPVSLPDASKLAQDDPYQFQWWALGLVGARPVEQKKGADKGIDGRIYFHDGTADKTQSIILSVKAGHVTSSQVRDLGGVLTREKAAIGVLLTMHPSTKDMRKEAANAGYYTSAWNQQEYPRLQILTIEELLAGKTINRPAAAQTSVTFKKAPKAGQAAAKNRPLAFADEDGDE